MSASKTASASVRFLHPGNETFSGRMKSNPANRHPMTAGYVSDIRFRQQSTNNDISTSDVSAEYCRHGDASLLMDHVSTSLMETTAATKSASLSTSMMSKGMSNGNSMTPFNQNSAS